MNKEQDTNNNGKEYFEISPLIKWPVAVLLSGTVIVMVYLYYCYIQCPSFSASPKDLGLPTIFIFCATGLVLILFPWHKFKVNITKIGPVEFEHIIEGQATEHAQDLSEIDDRLANLERKIKTTSYALLTKKDETKLKPLLLEFLTKYIRKGAFSPQRILKWGIEQEGFESFAEYDPALLRSTLRKLVAEKRLVTSVSKKGNTLYKISQ
ncbi:MAG: hypothetical protein KAT04_09580 [Methylococcales bacterium]|nr:hypothetical protein [Methylococcales bacterium]